MALSSGRGAAALPLRVHRLRPGLLVAVTLLLGLEAAVGGSTGTRLDEGNFRQLVGDENVWVVEVGSSRCGTCQEFAPVWGKVASQVGSRAKFGFVDIDEKGGMALAKELNALEDGVPQVRIFRRLRDEIGELLWTGWEIPTEGFLLEQLLEHLKDCTSADGSRYLKKHSDHQDDL